MGFGLPPSMANQAPLFFTLTDPRKNTLLLKDQLLYKMTIRAQAEAAMVSQARPGLAQSPGLAIAWPFPSTTAGRPQARPGRRPLGRDKGPGVHLAISSHPCECALVFMLPAWKNHGPGLPFPTHAATSAERRERGSPQSCSPWGMASVPWAWWLKASRLDHSVLADTMLDQHFKVKSNSFYCLSFHTALFISLRNIPRRHTFIARFWSYLCRSARMRAVALAWLARAGRWTQGQGKEKWEKPCLIPLDAGYN